MRFIHCADVHLGKTIDKNPIRYRDYFKAFEKVIEFTCERDVDFLIIAGDLFHRGNVHPETLADTVKLLEILKKSDVEVIAIEGNHDRFKRRKNESWLLYLSRRGYLRLLQPTEDPDTGSIYFEPYDSQRGWGGYIEIAGGTVYGMGYWGTSVGQQLQRASENMPQKADVGILHAGVWDNPRIDFGSLTTLEFQPFSSYFRYFALGHGHKKYQVPDATGRIFGYNPGALEVVNREESSYSDAGTAYLVEIDGEKAEVETLKIPRRPFYNLKVELTEAESPAQAFNIFDNYINKMKSEVERLQNKPVVSIDLVGKINFNPSEIEIPRFQSLVEDALQPVVLDISNRLSLIRNTSLKKSGGTQNIDQLNREAVKELVGEYPRYANVIDKMTNFVFHIKTAMENGSEKDDELIDAVHSFRKSIDEGRENRVVGRQEGETGSENQPGLS